MAKVITKMYQNNVNNDKTKGKYYSRVKHLETLSTEDLARHISEHGSPFNRSVIIGVLMATCDCLVELVKDSKKVRLGDLGTFYLSAESEGSETVDEYSVNNVKRLHLRFLPNHRRSYPLDSLTLRKQSSLMAIEQLTDTTATSGNGGSNDDDTPVVEQPGI